MSYRPGEFAGPYQVLQLIGRGAFGEVLLAQDARRPGHRVAIKLVACGLTDSIAAANARSAAVAEADLLRRLQHPHIVRCEDACSDAERSAVWLALEFMDGGSLLNIIDGAKTAGRTSLEPHFVRRVLVAVATALRYIHSEGVLHRDIKPANVLLTRDAQQIKLADFGISKLLEATGRALTVVGTPYYFSPELVSGQAYGPASDAWALGVCLYELVVLRRPFEATNPLALARRICEEEPTPGLPPTTDDDLARAISGLLLKDWRERLNLAQLLEVSDEIVTLVVEDERGTGAQPDAENITSVGSLIEEVLFEEDPSPGTTPHGHPEAAHAASAAASQRGAAPAFGSNGPDERTPKKEKKKKDRSGRWFRFRTFRSSPSSAKEGGTDSGGDEITMVSEFQGEADDTDSEQEHERSAAAGTATGSTPPSQKVGSVHVEEKTPAPGPPASLQTPRLGVPRLDTWALPGRALTSTKAWS